MARAREVDGEFTVLSGSQARSRWTGVAHGYAKQHESLMHDGTLVHPAHGKNLVFSHDQVFSSPSAAAAAVAGRNANGRLSWLIEGTTTTYGEWQSRDVDGALIEETVP